MSNLNKYVVLQVPYAKKDDARKIGCIFESSTKRWLIDVDEYTNNRIKFNNYTPIILLGDTFKYKDEIKEMGGAFNSRIRKWTLTKNKYDEYEEDIIGYGITSCDLLEYAKICPDTLVVVAKIKTRQEEIDELIKLMGCED